MAPQLKPRFSEEEAGLLRRRAAELGLTASDFLRSLALAAISRPFVKSVRGSGSGSLDPARRREIASQGGQARKTDLCPERRREIASLGGRARSRARALAAAKRQATAQDPTVSAAFEFAAEGSAAKPAVVDPAVCETELGPSASEGSDREARKKSGGG